MVILQLTPLITRWNRRDRFEIMSVFLRRRQLLRPAQMVLAAVAASASLVPLSAMLMQRPVTPGGWWVAVGGSAFAFGMAVFWLARWPTRLQSEVVSMGAIAVIAGWSLTQESPEMAALAASALAVTGGYLAFFHGSRAVLLNGVIALAVAVDAVWRLAAGGQAATAVAALWLVMFLNLAVPLSVSGLSRALRRYAMRADEDQLTGLFNRRGFVDEVTRILHETSQVPNDPGAPVRVAIFMVDIDNFKRINDSFGHAAGDQAILAVAQLLRRQAPLPAVICRAGGEEFLIAVVTRSDVVSMAHRLREAISGLPESVTVSVGIATVDVAARLNRDVGSLVTQLVAEADAAMYEVKGQGGNNVRHVGL
ncbi:MAG: GGDEF domain-containing protein [Mycolicibacterium cosmeticum]|nr:GGDEF domain-containing protein [Mycolicibacterium cosmeticum]